jgi:GTPase SAR1 family protein
VDVSTYLFCFKLTSQRSLENLEEFWIPQVVTYNKDMEEEKKEGFIPAKWILVGTMADLRREGTQENGGPVSTEAGIAFAKKHAMEAYMETSSLEGLNVDLAIYTAFMVSEEIRDPIELVGAGAGCIIV